MEIIVCVARIEEIDHRPSGREKIQFRRQCEASTRIGSLVTQLSFFSMLVKQRFGLVGVVCELGSVLYKTNPTIV
jgi:hypothetical protein